MRRVLEFWGGHTQLVRSVFNERGSVLGAAHVTGRMMPGIVHMPNGANYCPDDREPYKGLPINTICPLKTTSKNAFGMVTTGFLVQVEKWEGKLS